jgi:predicted DNA-binding transcriptional regulator YafY
MDRTERFYRIDQLLQERRIARFEEIQEALGVSRATVKRDLQYLRDRLNAPIVYDRLAGGYRFEQQGKHAPRYELPGLWFNASEIHALLMMQSLLEEVQPGLLGPHIAPLQARLSSLLGSQDDTPEDIARRIRIVHAARRKGGLAHFELIASALLKRHRLRIRHLNRATGKETEREVSPQRLIYYRGNWYVDCWCHLREEVRSFAVDAISAATLLDARAKEVAGKTLDATLGAGYGIFSGAQVEWAKLGFSPEHARWVVAEEWHPRQRASFAPDGRYLLEIPYANPTELVMDILRHGAGVEVLSPASLRKRVRQEIEAMARQYGVRLDMPAKGG